MNVEYGRSLTTTASVDAIGKHSRQQPSRRTLRFRLHALLMALDAICIVGSFWLAKLIHPAGADEQWLILPVTVLVIYLISAFGARAYSVEVIQRVSQGMARALQSFVIAVCAVLFVAFYLKASTDISRVLFGIGCAGSAFGLAAVRVLLGRYARSILGGTPYTIVLITETGEALDSGEFSDAISASNFDIESPTPEMYHRLASIFGHADRVVVGCELERRSAWVHALQGANVQAEILAPELRDIGPMSISRLGNSPTLVVAQGPLNLPDRVLKRLFDITIAGIALVVLAPLVATVALLIKLESPGPVFFAQTRIGRANKLFKMYKFRSMRADASDGRGHISTRRNDERVTGVGRIIRKASIDELPQLINVLKGDMSIVGPRPHPLGARAEDKLFWEIDQRYWHRHAAKPGLTGLAQVRGYRGATIQKSDLTNRLRSDLEYLNGWSIWRDIKIILLTFGVLIHPNAF